MIAALALWPLVWREWRHHPWRHGVALLAVCLGVALAWSVHLINGSALGEFAAAVRGANGEPDLSLSGQREGFDDALFERAAGDAAVLHASAVLELETYARAEPAAAREVARDVAGDVAGDMAPVAVRVAVRVLGVDALRLAPLAPALLPRPAPGESAQVAMQADVIFVNRAAREKLPGGSAALQSGERWHSLRIAGDVAVGGAPLVVMDIAAAQTLFGFDGRISRIDLRLQPGADVGALTERLTLPAGVRAVAPEVAEQRVSNLSRAYRVNLTVLALVALFVGAFLVYSVMSLSVAQRTPALALLGVLGMTSRGRRAMVLGECALIGAAGSLLGLALGTGLAALALRALAGDLGGGYFGAGLAPPLSWSTPAAALFALLGVLSALAGGFVPARAAERLAPALALKGLGQPGGAAPPAWPGLALLALGVALAFAPPVAGLPLAAYGAVAALLCGGVALVPAVVHGLVSGLSAPRTLLPLLAWRRAEHQRATATAATAGVVSSLALAVALTVMVASFRTSVAQWLDQVLPADLYARSGSTAAIAETVSLPADFEARVRALPGVARVTASRLRSLQLEPGRPAVTLMARPMPGQGIDPSAALPLVAPALPSRESLPDLFVSEAVQALYGARPGTRLVLPLRSLGDTGGGGAPTATQIVTNVRGVYRDFARQFGSVLMERELYRRLTGDTRITDLALWLEPGAQPQSVMAAMRALLPDPALLDFATTGELRAVSLAIFDRSFAVTYYLQAVAIAIGLVGVAASLSAQVLARRKEFGLLTHVGLTRGQLLWVVSTEAAAWVAAGTLVGLLLGLAVSAVLVHVVNPQSFHWTMEMVLPAGRLAALCAAVFAAGTLTSAWAARGATARSAVLSVKEDW